MTTIQILGKPAEVREQFAELTLPEDTLICLTVDELTPEMQAKQENAEMMRRMEEKYADYPRVNGIIQVPSPISLTPDEVKEMLCRMEMEEVLGEHAAMMCRYDEEFADVPRVYGILQVPISEPMTVERIKELSED